MDIGLIVIQHKEGVAVVSRYEAGAEGATLVLAHNAADLTAAAAEVLARQQIALQGESIYLCTDELQAAATFPPLKQPEDICSLREAERLLYPNATSGLAWEQLEDMRARRICTYRVGIGQNMRAFASRADVEARARARAAS
ncbi:MAG TPA: hypothetical protein PKD53_08905 [Chloroflexaceae bacterium]|nr:hypothetical protein [Chloroflexaceae bacterium]